MRILGYTLIKTKELQKYQDDSFKNDFVNRLNQQIKTLRDERRKYEERPDLLIMGRYYSSEICDQLLRIIPTCRKDI